MLAFAKVVEGPEQAHSLRSRWPWLALFGVLTGCAMGTKLTGWFVPIPFLAWVILYRDRRGVVALVIGMLLALCLLVVLIPPWWHNPVLGLDRFFQSNLSRATTTPLKTLFLGTIYETPTGSLPWYNTLVWTVLVTPVGFLAAGVLGCCAGCCRGREDTAGVAVPCSLGVSHDPAGLAAYARSRRSPSVPAGLRHARPAGRPRGGIARAPSGRLGSIADRPGGHRRRLERRAHDARAAILLQPLDRRIAGCGEPGHGADLLLGLASAGDPRLAELAHDDRSESEVFTLSDFLALSPSDTSLAPGILPYEPGQWTWYVMQNRPGAMPKLERDLIAHGHPAKVFSKWGVPLLWVFPYHEVEAWQSGKLAALTGIDGPVGTSVTRSVLVDGSFSDSTACSTRVSPCWAWASSGSRPMARRYQARASSRRFSDSQISPSLKKSLGSV